MASPMERKNGYNFQAKGLEFGLTIPLEVKM